MRRLGCLVAGLLLCGPAANAQSISQRGLVEGRAVLFGQEAPNDSTRAIGDALLREEVFLSAGGWFELAGGVDLRANSHDQVEDEWRFDVRDEGMRRPRLSLRRFSISMSGGGVSLELGKQFVRWARTDVLNPTDRFAPRDFLNVIDSEFLAVRGGRVSWERGSEALEAVWLPRPTPSRMPLLDQRWTVLPPEAAGLTLVDEGIDLPRRAQYGVRWRHVGSRLETSLSLFDGSNHLPHIAVRPLAEGEVGLTRTFPRLRTYGADVAVPTGWFTVKGEAAYFHAPTDAFGDYTLYVVELERQAGEWLLTGGYAGEIVSESSGELLAFDPERGLARSFVGRAAYTVDPRRTVAVEGALRRNGDGVYVKGDYSHALGQYVRITLTGVLITGDDDDFLGQFHRNSHVTTGLRVSF